MDGPAGAVHERRPLKALRGRVVRVHARVMEALAGHPVTRRSLLAGAASVAAGWGSLGPSGATASRAAGVLDAASPGAADWRAFARDLSGALLRPGDDRYAQAVRTFDPRRDGVRPRAVVQVSGHGDVVTTLDFVQRFGLAVRPRSGGHSYVGASTGNGVLVLDTGGFGCIRVAPGARQA